MALRGFKNLFLTKITDKKTAAQGDTEGVGTLRKEGNEWYRWCRNVHTVALVAGEPVVYKIASGSRFYKDVDQPASADLNTFAGIAMSAIAVSGFGWIQIEGYYASCIFSIGKTDITAGINAYPADTVDYMVGGDQMSATQVSILNQMAGRVQLAQSIASSSASAAGSDAKTTAVGGFIHCLTV